MSRPPLTPETEVRWLPGVGPKRAAALERLGIHQVRDLWWHLPHRYEDLSKQPVLNDVVVGETVTVRGRVMEEEIHSGGRGRRSRFEIVLADTTGSLNVTWFGRTRANRVCRLDAEVVLSGPVTAFRGKPQMVNPTIESAEEAAAAASATGGIRPIYPATEGVPAPLMRKLVAQAAGLLESAPETVVDPLPPEVRSRRQCPPLARALRTMHRPASLADAEAARNRLAYDELLWMQLVLALRRRLVKTARKAVPLAVPEVLDARIRRRLPYAPTPGQEAVIREIRADLEAPKPMHRLLQGDVGSGKTLVAVYAMLAAVGNKAQAALLAPTEVLAEQHHATLSAMLEGAPLQPVLLHGKQPAAERRAVEAGLADGRHQLVVATHALLSAGVEFQRLSVLVVDEQQRFGVRQKAAAVAKGARPDVLVTTATPIPRTLALTLFGDLDVSVLRGFPPGKAAVTTTWLRQRERERMWRAVQETVRRGERVFVVAPRIGSDEDGGDDMRSAESLAEELTAHLPAGTGVGLMHGRLPMPQRRQVMEEFRRGTVQVLAATTVIEVGVDVPEATLMVIEDADRFGLAQLHQLRGRVGRGERPGTCLLVGDPTTPEGKERLRTLEATADGFRVAEADLTLRGPGELFGFRQSGLPDLRVARLPDDVELLADARDDALDIVEADPSLSRSEHHALREQLMRRYPDGAHLIGVA
jgi:ATP-dependent DNA helicase RecG